MDGSGYRVLYNFDAVRSDEAPRGGLAALDGKLYGTTSGGFGATPPGTVFRVDPATGVEKVLYYFYWGADGDDPYAGLITVNGRLYGTTSSGGVYGFGTVFSVTKAGKERVLYSFGGGNDGATPAAPLLEVSGKLYGTTFGEANDGGTAFSVTLDGQETVLHRFAGYPNGDGLWPWAPLIDIKGVLYGTTTAGGMVLYGKAHEGAGTVFSISPSGNENVLYSFRGYGNGSNPMAGLVNVNGTLFGTTTNGGDYSCGTVFRIEKNGAQKVIHSFGNVPDGCYPYAGLINVNGTLYGTTGHGGGYYEGRNGGGTVFSITQSGQETVLHSFGYGADGSDPLAGLTNLKGTLYGTTSAGGAHNYGTVFAIKP